jgi:hypothetical protein
MKMEQTECSETSEYKIQTRRITQKKAYIIIIIIIIRLHNKNVTESCSLMIVS